MSLKSLLRRFDVMMCSGAVFSQPPPVVRRVDTGAAVSSVDDVLKLCRQAECGVDGKTVTDTDVRRTMKVGKEVVSVEWPHLEGVLKHVSQQLSIPGTVTAELHDVLVYRPGDFFKPHVDSIKHPDHRATLVVDTGLGGECSGGQLVVGESVWTTGGAGAYAAWFTNATHEMHPVIGGHRVVATYNVLSPYVPDRSRICPPGAKVVTRRSEYEEIEDDEEMDAENGQSADSNTTSNGSASVVGAAAKSTALGGLVSLRDDLGGSRHI